MRKLYSVVRAAVATGKSIRCQEREPIWLALVSKTTSRKLKFRSLLSIHEFLHTMDEIIKTFRYARMDGAGDPTMTAQCDDGGVFESSRMKPDENLLFAVLVPCKLERRAHASCRKPTESIMASRNCGCCRPAERPRLWPQTAAARVMAATAALQ